jgi:hypothetical protein
VKDAVGVVHAGEVEGQRDQPAGRLAVKPAIIEWHEFAHVRLPDPSLDSCKHNCMNQE